VGAPEVTVEAGEAMLWGGSTRYPLRVRKASGKERQVLGHEGVGHNALDAIARIVVYAAVTGYLINTCVKSLVIKAHMRV
jgi:hypothetical protein